MEKYMLLAHPADLGRHKRFAAGRRAPKVVAGLQCHICSPALSLLPCVPDTAAEHSALYQQLIPRLLAEFTHCPRYLQ